MTQLMVPLASAELANVDEVLSISMLGDTVVARLNSTPDAIGTQVLSDVVNAASVAGSTVMLHRRGWQVDSSVSIEMPSAEGTTGEPLEVETAGIGLLQVRTDGAMWTIDVGSARFIRTDRPLHRLFLSASTWTSYDAVCIAPQYVRACTREGSYVASRRNPITPAIGATRDDPGVPQLLSDIA